MSEAETLCARCLNLLHPCRGGFFRVRIEALADPTPPSFREEDLDLDHRAEIRELVEAMEGITTQEAKDQVHRSLEICLCDSCFRDWIEDPV